MTRLPSGNTSITTGETFAHRAQRNDERRLLLWGFSLLALALTACLRRWTGGLVMGSDAVFFPYMAIALGGAAAQLVVYTVSRRATRAGTLVSPSFGRWGPWFDLTIPAGMMLVLHFASPRGPMLASVAPVLLYFPLTVMLSVMRLRPGATLATGLAAAAFHAVLTLRALITTDAPVDQYKLYLTYAMLLAVIALAGSIVSRSMREHVMATVAEAEAREASDRRAAIMDREMGVAAEIQRSLLPSTPPVFPGFEVAGVNRPADMAGGDYYDWQVLPDGRLLAVMADVSGHGIGPALVMAVCRAYSRAAMPDFSDPTPFMRKLNGLLEADMPVGRFITLAIAAVEPAGRVQLLSAGHGPTLHYRASDATVSRFGGDGVPLGVLSGEEYAPAASLLLEEGDMLLLLTDGYFEWIRPEDGEQFGIARIEHLLLTSAGQPPHEILRRLDNTVRSFAGDGPQKDDTTALLIRRNARPAD